MNKLRQLTEKDEIHQIWKDQNSTIDQVYDKWSKEHISTNCALAHTSLMLNYSWHPY